MVETQTDNYIIDLFWQRNELAIKETVIKYENYCLRIAMNILNNRCDAEEIVSDTYLQIWNSIPPTRPNNLSAYIGKIARNLSINKYNARITQKRIGSEYTLSLEELSECISDKVTDTSYDDLALSQCINEFLRKQKKEHRIIFVLRYFYYDCIDDIAKNFNVSVSKVKSVLFRMRNKLQKYLEKNYE